MYLGLWPPHDAGKLWPTPVRREAKVFVRSWGGPSRADWLRRNCKAARFHLPSRGVPLLLAGFGKACGGTRMPRSLSSITAETTQDRINPVDDDALATPHPPPLDGLPLRRARSSSSAPDVRQGLLILLTFFDRSLRRQLETPNLLARPLTTSPPLSSHILFRP